MTEIQYCRANPPTHPRMPPMSTISGTRVCRNPNASASPSIGRGEYASIRRYPASYARRAARRSDSSFENSAISPYIPRRRTTSSESFRFGHQAAQLEDRDDRQDPNEQKHERQEQAD